MPNPTQDSGSITTSSSVTPSPSLSQATPTPEYPNLSRFADPLDRFAYRSAYSDCHLIGVAGTADAFGGDPNDPRAVARAYAEAVFGSSGEHLEATFQGCLDAFETDSPS